MDEAEARMALQAAGSGGGSSASGQPAAQQKATPPNPSIMASTVLSSPETLDVQRCLLQQTMSTAGMPNADQIEVLLER